VLLEKLEGDDHWSSVSRQRLSSNLEEKLNKSKDRYFSVCCGRFYEREKMQWLQAGRIPAKFLSGSSETSCK
jgi:hypothetical protein